MALSNIKGLADQIQTAMSKPSGPTVAPFVMRDGMSQSDKALLPASVVKMASGAFGVVPLKNTSSFGRQPKLFGTADGKLVPPTRAIDLSGIASIALGASRPFRDRICPDGPDLACGTRLA